MYIYIYIYLYHVSYSYASAPSSQSDHVSTIPYVHTHSIDVYTYMATLPAALRKNACCALLCGACGYLVAAQIRMV